jgi:hypothetical protein
VEWELIVGNRQSAVGSQQSAVRGQEAEGAVGSRQSAVRNPQSAIRNPQSAIRNGEEVVLTWPDLRNVPGEVSLMLVDTVSGERRSLRTTRHYVYRPAAGEAARRFQVIAERGRERSLRILGLHAEASRGPGMSLTFSLTKAAQTTVVVRTLSGQEVGSIEVLRSRSAGANTAPWEGRDRQGRPLPPGVYLVEVQAVDEEGGQVRAVRGVTIR